MTQPRGRPARSTNTAASEYRTCSGSGGEGDDLARWLWQDFVAEIVSKLRCG
jgi:hypothetical protein